MSEITSRRNPIVARFREVARGQTPGDAAVLLEGPRLIKEALSAGTQIELVAVTVSMSQGDRVTLVDQLAGLTRVVNVSPSVMHALSPVPSPSGLVAIGRLQTATFESTTRANPALVLGLLDVQNPGNTGAIIRAAEAGGASGVVVVGGADPFGWKALRGSMGSALRLPVARATGAESIRAHAKTHGLRILAATPRGGTPAANVNLAHPCMIWLGSEGRGLGRTISDYADELISIPMHAPVESLNIAVAAALLVYEASRQRNRTPSISGRGERSA